MCNGIDVLFSSSISSYFRHTVFDAELERYTWGDPKWTRCLLLRQTFQLSPFNASLGTLTNRIFHKLQRRWEHEMRWRTVRTLPTYPISRNMLLRETGHSHRSQRAPTASTTSLSSLSFAHSKIRPCHPALAVTRGTPRCTTFASAPAGRRQSWADSHPLLPGDHRSIACQPRCTSTLPQARTHCPSHSTIRYPPPGICCLA